MKKIAVMCTVLIGAVTYYLKAIRAVYLVRHDFHANFIQGKVICLGHLLSEDKE